MPQKFISFVNIMPVLEKKKMFDIVQFIDSDDDTNQSIDCVPSTWISFDHDTHKLMTKFMPPPYTTKKCNALHKLVKEMKDAPDKWPNYHINIMDSADNYSEAILKMEKLKHEDYVYTTDYTDIENINEKENKTSNIQVTRKYKEPIIRDMKGNISRRRNSSSSGILF